MKEFSKINKLNKNEYYHSPEGYIIFTEKYHLDRGYEKIEKKLSSCGAQIKRLQ